MIKLDLSLVNSKNDNVVEKSKNAFNELISGKIEMTGWVDLPISYDKEEFEQIKKVAKEVRENADTLVVIGIGGSYLGAKAAIDFLSDYYKNNNMEIIFVGNGLSEKYLAETLEYVKSKNFYVNIISKSGGTLEPAVAFKYFRELAENKYGANAKNRILATTDKNKGILKNMATEKGYRTFVVPDDVGGRYSVLTAVGLLPIAVAGFDIEELMLGAKEMRECLIDEKKINENIAIKYAIKRNELYLENKDIEVFSTLTPNMRYFGEWLKQLFGESECKENKGIFPASLTLTADLHSMGQLMQQGKRNIFETFINIEEDYAKENKLILIETEKDEDKLNYASGNSVNELNNIAFEATKKAHFDGDVPVISINVKKQNEKTLGELFYFFEFACGISALILGVNPFNQPGVEAYKSNIKSLLKK